MHADRLLILTDVSAVVSEVGPPKAAPRRKLDLRQLVELTFSGGSVGPHMAACRQFVEATGRPAAIGAIIDTAAILTRVAGTTITAKRQERSTVLVDQKVPAP